MNLKRNRKFLQNQSKKIQQIHKFHSLKVFSVQFKNFKIYILQFFNLIKFKDFKILQFFEFN